MAYKSIFTILTGPDGLTSALTPVIEFTGANGGNLDALALAVDRTQAGYTAAGMGVAMQDIGLAAAIEARDEIDAAAREVLEPSGVRWSLEGVASPSVSVSAVVADRARMADIVILPKPYGADQPHEAPIVLEAALFQARVPVIVVPRGMSVPMAPSHALIAWNESPEALAAIRAAIPILKNADKVEILVIDPGRHGVGGADPGVDLAAMLARHGAEVSITVAAQTLPRVSDVIAREAQDRGSDLLVMGAYSHSRFREAILGGTTRNLLESTELPILMAH